MKELNIWCDGACVPNPGIGGYASIVLEHDVPMFAVMGYEEQTTNNRMEMMAVIASLEEKDPQVNLRINLYSDSQYVINPMTKGWGRGTNTDLWKRIIYRNNILDINWIKVKGHSGLRYNEECDTLATYCMHYKQPRKKIQYDRIVEYLDIGKAYENLDRHRQRDSRLVNGFNMKKAPSPVALCSLDEWLV